ncbi:hypothetical protein EG328_001325 [Venturia inaequalis]|uniref:BPL/LPL catalytic domain-containing protein n=2 Tax=Venturia inaequalis TaxID=5025 RepID=A0A8H3VHQ3_VENIN|nr:hypothetical protein EG328_001325 [Venturia inaequalis]
MANKRVNVLVYSGPGSTVESVRHCLYSLRRLLSPNYAVIPVNGDAIIKEPWSASCALIVFPGGADLGYCRTLNGEGNRKISQFVNRGGAYLGLCAGGYYASSRCEFMVGDQKMEVVGVRELGFFPDTCRGLAFPGFVYHSEAGARAAEIKINKAAFATSGGTIPDTFHAYFNGGGIFVNAEKHKARGIEVLANYTEEVNVDAGEGAPAAVVFRKVGDGSVILTSTHPEFATANLNKKASGPEFEKVFEALEEDDKLRVDFFKACLVKLGLQVNQAEQSVPSLSRLHLSSILPTETAELVASLEEVITKTGDEEYINGENDTFLIEKPERWSMDALKEAISGSAEEDTEDTILDYNAVTKRVVPHEEEWPTSKETPYFNHHAYFANLAHYIQKTNGTEGWFGKHLLYGEVVTSTSTMLEKNPSLLRHLETGFTATATTQIAGRGRGSNVWVSPPGSLMFSTVIKHPMSLTQQAPIVFIQYLTALAIVRGIHSYAPGGYSTLPVKLKWPNDIYALDPKAAAQGKTGRDAYVKIGGILVNSSYAGADYTLVVGVGLNLANAAPTTSLNALASASGTRIDPFTPEKLLARILTSFESVYNTFCREGWSHALEAEYYKNWLHTEQVVTLETEGGARARIKGITRDWGLLLAEELGWEDRKTGKVWTLQSDSNSFDFFKGLLRRKV